MEPKAHHVLIGLFVVLCSAAALLFALWLSDAQTDRKYTPYVVCFDQAVSGLAEGNSVLYNGIKVGDVVKLGLSPEDPRRVRAAIRVYSDIPVKEDTTASLTLANITGSMSIQLSGGTPDSPLLRSSGKNPADIQAQPSSLSALLTGGEDMVKKVVLLLTQMNSLLSGKNVDNISSIISNFEELSEDLSGQGEHVAQTLKSIDRAADKAEQTFADFAEVGVRLREDWDEDGRPMLASARKSMAGLNRMVDKFQKLLDSNDTSLERGLQGLGELEPVMRELRATLSNLRSITRQIEEDPTEFILGNGSVEEFSP
jgi:phospholipid/cholesterol/gamma-HCH transport system substrate-binding protein